MARHLILTDVVPSLNYNRLGIVTYAGTGFPMAFLSDDMLALDWMLKRALVMGSAPGENSEMGKAFSMAYTLFDLDSKPENRKVIVLFSDGGNDTELPELHATIAELQKRGTQFQFMAYPGAKHGLNLPGQRAHVYHLIENFFQQQVKGAAPAPRAAKSPDPAPAATTR